MTSPLLIKPTPSVCVSSGENHPQPGRHRFSRDFSRHLINIIAGYSAKIYTIIAGRTSAPSCCIMPPPPLLSSDNLLLNAVTAICITTLLFVLNEELFEDKAPILTEQVLSLVVEVIASIASSTANAYKRGAIRKRTGMSIRDAPSIYK